MKTEFGNRIKSARLLAGLSLRELASLLEGRVSHTAINKFEKGELMPDAKVLTALARLLNVNTDYFLRPKTVEITKIEFRKRNSLASKHRRSINESVIDHIERYLELEGFLQIKNAFSNPVSRLMICNADDVEKAAEKILDVWRVGFNAIPNVVELLENKEVKVIEIAADEKFDGLSGWANDEIPVVVINRDFSIERKRFTALHELGHLLLNFDKGLDHREVEKLCHRFAGAMLLPRPSIFNELGLKRKTISLNELIFVKESYGISMAATMSRAKDLGIISNDQYVQFRIWVNRNERHKKEIGMGSFRGIEQSTRFKQLLYRATAEEIISMSKAASLGNMKLAEFRDEFMAI
jgi:Zn-dependent peptidase ImmA (M78 family)/transcriptional regulator with XRE-family HTH domain